MRNVFGTNRSETIDLRRGSGDGPDFPLEPGDNDEFIFALNGNDVIYAGGGHDVIKGGGGADTIFGGSGRDIASYFDSDTSVIVSLATGRGFGGTANGDRLFDIEWLIGSTHSDLLVGDDQANRLYGLAGNDTLRGGGGRDHLLGDSGNDNLYGEADTDEISGGSGRDRLIGGTSGDLMTGGADGDTFVFTRMADFGDGSGHAHDFDVITDFEIGTDVVDLSAIDADPTRDGDQAFSVVSSFTGEAGQLMIVERYLVDAGNVPAIVIDIDGDGAEDAILFVYTSDYWKPQPLPSATDIIL